MRFLAAAVLACALTSPLHAQTPAAPIASDEEAAKAHFAAGSAYYEQAAYADAVKEFNEAYRLSGRVDLLYNIAICYEHLEKWDEAIATLHQYLAVRPGAADRNTIQTRIMNYEKLRDAARAEAATPQKKPAAVAVTPPPKWARRYVASLVLGEIGLAALISSIGTGVAALVAKSDLDGRCPKGVCPESARADVDRGQALAISTDVLIGVGAAAVVVGAVLLIVETRRPARRAQVRASGGGLTIRF
jgi:tetratricopeptide (TPR) repeat protein